MLVLKHAIATPRRDHRLIKREASWKVIDELFPPRRFNFMGLRAGERGTRIFIVGYIVPATPLRIASLGVG